jgi:hypothetical protein
MIGMREPTPHLGHARAVAALVHGVKRRGGRVMAGPGVPRTVEHAELTVDLHCSRPTTNDLWEGGI